MKKIFKYLLLLLVILLVGVAVYCWQKTRPEGQAADYKNIAYMIEGESVLLHDGVAEVEAAPGSATKITTRYFGNEARGDFNGDGRQDVAFLITQDGGGSGTFYYLVCALGEANGYIGTNAIFIGDGIAPQTTAFNNGEIIVNYVGRKPEEPMSATPSVGTTKYFKVLGNSLTEQSNQ